jgi:phenylacetate-coenzyme A ligase PaaK-like adenylate-forming protein
MTQTGNNITYDISELEYLPLDRLLILSEQKMATTVNNCSSLPIYREKWVKSSLQRFDNLKFDLFKQLPFVTEKDFTGDNNNLSFKKSGLPHVQLWNNADGVNPTLWLPRGIDDITDYTQHAVRIMNLLGLAKNDCLLILNQPSIGSANMFPYVIAKALKSADITCQVITIDIGLIEQISKWIDFVNQNRPTVMIAQGNDAIKLSKILENRDNNHKSSPGDLKQDKNRLMPYLKTILLYGSDCNAHKTQVESVYGCNIRISIGLLDLRLDAMECPAHQGIHMWLDNGIYELIPDNNIKTTDFDSTKCQWIWEAEAGTKGELVITNFAGALPLIRYRSGYQIEIIGNGICDCGRTHPRVRLI